MIFHSTYKKPILIVGSGLRAAGAMSELNAFVDKTNIPVLTTMNSVDVVNVRNRVGFIGVYGNRVANMVLAETDLIIAIGARLGLRQIGNKIEYFAPKAHLIRVDIDQNELSRTIKRDEEKCLIDAKDYLKQLLTEDIADYSEWKKQCIEARDMLEPYDKEEGNYCIEAISNLLPESPIVALDVGQNQCWSAQTLRLRGKAGRILVGGGYGSMGCGLPYAIGSSYATDNGIVYCITGDGGLQMNIQELETVHRDNLPIKILVINNRSLGKIKEIQDGSYNGRRLITDNGSGYSTPDFEKISVAYGIKAATIESYERLIDYASWFTDNEPCLINIILSDSTLLLPKMNWNQKDMLPELDPVLIGKVKDILSR